jgi:hypothetical protein
MVKIRPYFQTPFEMNFFVFVKTFILNWYIIEISKWDFILMDFIGFFLGLLVATPLWG